MLDFDGDLYGSELRLDFLARLRGERRFDTPAALVEQMRRDVEQTARDRRPPTPCATPVGCAAVRRRCSASVCGRDDA